MLLLLEAPGRSGAVLTNIVSVDNPDKTARRTLALLLSAGLDPAQVLNWNIVPWPAAKPSTAEVAAGANTLPGVLALLPRLRCVVLMGGSARRGWARLGADFPQVRPYEAWHPVQRAGRVRDLASARALRAAGREAGLRMVPVTGSKHGARR